MDDGKVGIYRYFKRVIGFVISLIGFIVLIPVFLILIVCIKLDSKGPILFKQRRIGLHKKEFNILKTLIEKYPQVITRESLLDSIWGYDYYGDTRIVDAHIKNLRKKISLPYIKTVKGIGYTLEKDIENLE